VVVLNVVTGNTDSLIGGSQETHYRCLALQPAKERSIQIKYEEEEDYDTLLQRELRN